MDSQDKIIETIDALLEASKNLIDVYRDTGNNIYLELSDKINLLNTQLLEEQKDEINQTKWANGN